VEITIHTRRQISMLVTELGNLSDNILKILHKRDHGMLSKKYIGLFVLMMEWWFMVICYKNLLKVLFSILSRMSLLLLPTCYLFNQICLKSLTDFTLASLRNHKVCPEETILIYW
jgi:hypothetical protein